MKVKRSDFINALNLVKPGAGDLLGGPKVVMCNNGWLHTQNESVAISCKFETGIEGLLPIDHLYQALKIFKSEGLSIAQGMSTVAFGCGFSELSLKLILDPDHRFRKPNLNNFEWSPAPARLLEGLKLALWAAEDSAIGKLSGIVITGSTILATDNYGISKYNMGESIAKDAIRFRTSVVKALVKMKRDFDFVCVSDKGLHLKSKDDLIISVQLIPSVDYPLEDVQAVFNQWPESGDPVYKLPAHLEPYIDRAQLLAGIGQGELNFDTQISLKSSCGNLIITGQNGVGALANKIPWDGVIPNLTISPTTLKKLLKLTRSFRVSQNKNMVLFEPPNFKFLILAKAEQMQEQAEI